MSKMPYVIQHDSPNLVIVPTESCYEPSPKKSNLDSTSSSIKVPEYVQVSENGALVNKAGVKAKPRVSSVNENVLIDVSKMKRQQNSWATNFLQSIGGPGSKVPRAYNWHPSASKLAFLRNENIQPINYLPIARPAVHTNTTQPNANKKAIQLKPANKLALPVTNTNASKPNSNKDFSLSNEIPKSNPPSFQPKPKKKDHQPNEVSLLKTINKQTSHLKATKIITETKTEKETSQLKSCKKVTQLKAIKKLTDVIATKKNSQTKAAFQTKFHKEATKMRGNSETCRIKENNKSSESKVHKEKFTAKTLKDSTEKKPLKAQIAEVNRKNHEKTVTDSGKDNNKKSKDNSIKSKDNSKKSKDNSKKSKDNSKKSKDNSKKRKHESSHTSSKSSSPLRSVVKKVKNCTSDDPKHRHEHELIHSSHDLEKTSNKESDDLRAKLKRKAPKSNIDTQVHGSRYKSKRNNIFPTAPNGKGFVPDDNLIISFRTESDTDEVIEKMKPEKTKTRKSSGNKCKKIKLEINITFQKNDSSDEESQKRGDKEEHENNNDLSFLDDFNVDEIAESLNGCQSNIVKIENIINLNENNRTSKMDVDLPITNENAVIKNESISKDKIIIYNETKCNENSTEKERKDKELKVEVQSLTDHTCVANINNNSIEVISKNMLEPRRESETYTHVIGGVKTELASNDCSNNVESSKDVSVTNSNNTGKLSETVTFLGDAKFNNITPEEVNNSVPSAQMDGRDNKANVTTLNNMKNKSITKSDKNTKAIVDLVKVKTDEPSIFFDNTKNEDNIILIEDSDNDGPVTEVQSQSLVKQDVVDLTHQKGCSLDSLCKEAIFVAAKPKTDETDSEPILILDTDYDELKAKADIKNKKEIINSINCPEPLDVIKKHLFCKNATEKIITPPADDNKDAATIKTTVKDNSIMKDTTDCTKARLDQRRINTQRQKELNGSKKSDLVGNQIPITKEIHANEIRINKNDTIHNTVMQNQQKTNAQDHGDGKLNSEEKFVTAEKQISPTNENDDINITKWLENKISQHMKYGINYEEKSAPRTNPNASAKENHNNKISMWVVNKGDTRTNTVVENQPKSNPQDTKDDKPKIVHNMNTQNVNAKCQPKLSNKTTAQAVSAANKNATANKKQDNKTSLVKGDPRTKQNQSKTNSPDTKNGKPKTVNSINSQNSNAKYQPKVPHNSQAKGNNLTSLLAPENLIQLDLVGRKLECRMREYFGAKYCVTDLIHSGQFSSIYLCKDGSGLTKTVKQFKSSWQMGAFKEAMMIKLQNGVPEDNYNCVRYFHGFTMAGHWCYLMEYYPKNLHEAMIINNRSFNIDTVQDFSRQLVAAVTILRNNNIIHSDINPQHILINDSETRIKLCGFDQAFYYNGGDLLPNVGTVNYRAPELILGFHADYGIDVWSTALVMYEMAANRQLFPGFYNNDILYKHFCTVEKYPYDMLEHSYYRDQHFMGDAFVRIVGSRGEGKVLVHNFFKKERIYSVLTQVYQAEWARFRLNRASDKNKLHGLGELLNKMLVMDPRTRIAIEFVFADPFIYQMFN